MYVGAGSSAGIFGQAGEALIDRIKDAIRFAGFIVQLDVIVLIFYVTSRIVHKEYLE